MPRRIVHWLIGIAIAAGILTVMPLFRVVSLEATQQQAVAAAFDPVAVVDALWTDELREAAGAAVPLPELLTALRADPAAAAANYGRRLGLSGTSAYWVSGRGVITGVDGKAVEIAVDGAGDTRIAIRFGPVFGNAIRDGSALVDVSDFANTRDFNALSVEINRRVESEVLPALADGASVDRVVAFTGGVEIPQGDTLPATLEIVPYRVEFP